MDAIRAAILALDDWPMTVRQVFYRLVSAGVIGKTEGEYKQTVVRLLTQMRRDGSLPYHWIADNTRWMRKPTTFDSLTDAVQHTAEFYRRSVWQNQDAYVEIWLEKDALSGVLYSITSEYDVPLMVTRGYPSLSFLHAAGEAIRDQGKPTFLYYFGDHDPSGVDIPDKVEAGIRDFAPDIEIHFTRVAVLPWQIEAWELPTRPTKKSDSRSSSFKGESVEVDAITPAKLREIASDCITKHIDARALHTLEVAEQSERDYLYSLAELTREQRWEESR